MTFSTEFTGKFKDYLRIPSRIPFSFKMGASGFSLIKIVLSVKSLRITKVTKYIFEGQNSEPRKKNHNTQIKFYTGLLPKRLLHY